jgi:hypothetical protein
LMECLSLYTRWQDLPNFYNPCVRTASFAEVSRAIFAVQFEG